MILLVNHTKLINFAYDPDRNRVKVIENAYGEYGNFRWYMSFDHNMNHYSFLVLRGSAFIFQKFATVDQMDESDPRGLAERMIIDYAVSHISDLLADKLGL